jgi:hypothetical protein
MHTSATVVEGWRRRQVTLYFTLLPLLAVMTVGAYVTYVAASLSCRDEELRNILLSSFFLSLSTIFYTSLP